MSHMHVTYVIDVKLILYIGQYMNALAVLTIE